MKKGNIFAYVNCRYKEDCCFRNEYGKCKILNDTKFRDNKCHFRKLKPNGRNEYDAYRKR